MKRTIPYIFGFKSIFILIALGLACQIAFKIIGSTIDANGYVIEPFYLIPLGFSFFLIGAVFLVVNLGWRFVSQFR